MPTSGESGYFVRGRLRRYRRGTSEVTELDKSRRKLRCQNALQHLGLRTWIARSTRTGQAWATRMAIGVGC